MTTIKLTINGRPIEIITSDKDLIFQLIDSEHPKEISLLRENNEKLLERVKELEFKMSVLVNSISDLKKQMRNEVANLEEKKEPSLTKIGKCIIFFSCRGNASKKEIPYANFTSNTSLRVKSLILDHFIKYGPSEFSWKILQENGNFAFTSMNKLIETFPKIARDYKLIYFMSNGMLPAVERVRNILSDFYFGIPDSDEELEEFAKYMLKQLEIAVENKIFEN